MSAVHAINHQIRGEKVLLIVGNENKGIVNISMALVTAQEQGLDLVQVGQEEKYPVCKILDYNKFKYTQKKKNKKQKIRHQKEIRMGYRIEERDLDVKINKVKQLISKDCDVKITMQMKGREVQFLDDAVEKMKDICSRLDDIVEHNSIGKEQKTVSVRLTPKRKG